MPETVVTPSDLTERATIPIFSAAELSAAAASALKKAREQLAKIEAVPLDAVTCESVLDMWDETAIALEDAFGPISLLNSVHPEKDVRDVADRALIDESVFLTELFQNEKLYERVHRVEPRSGPQKQLRKDLLEAFEDSGVSLPPEKRQRFKEISERLTEVSQEFAKNIRENRTQLHFSPDECEGVPQSLLDRVKRDAEGNVVIGFDYPDYMTFMQNARSGEARRRYYIANTNRGTPRNIEIMDEIVALRREIASLHGVPSFAHYVTKRRMVENPETVAEFLDEVKNVVTAAEVRDLRQLAEVKAELTGAPIESARIERWDVMYFRSTCRCGTTM
jgi:thimet oligopeptidase